MNDSHIKPDPKRKRVNMQFTTCRSRFILIILLNAILNHLRHFETEFIVNISQSSFHNLQVWIHCGILSNRLVTKEMQHSPNYFMVAKWRL